MENTHTSLQLKKGSNHLAKVIFNFVIDNDYGIFTSDYEMQHDIIYKSFYTNHIKRKKEKIIKELNDINFYDNHLFITSLDREELIDIQKTLYNFQLAIIDVLKQDGSLIKGEASKTSPSPPLTVKVGNNKLDIKPTGKDYGLLFR